MKRRTTDDVIEAYKHNAPELFKAHRAWSKWVIPYGFMAGALASILGGGVYAVHEQDKLLPEGGMTALLDKCEPLLYQADKSWEQREEERRACVDKVWLPAKERRDEILTVAMGVSGTLMLAGIFSGAVWYARTRRFNNEAKESIHRYVDGLDFRRGDRKGINVINGGKPPEPKA